MGGGGGVGRGARAVVAKAQADGERPKPGGSTKQERGRGGGAGGGRESSKCGAAAAAPPRAAPVVERGAGQRVRLASISCSALGEQYFGDSEKNMRRSRQVVGWCFKIPVWWRRAVLPSLPWVVFLSFFLFVLPSLPWVVRFLSFFSVITFHSPRRAAPPSPCPQSLLRCVCVYRREFCDFNTKQISKVVCCGPLSLSSCCVSVLPPALLE